MHVKQKKNNMGDTNILKAWDKDKTNEEGIVYINWRVIMGLVDSLDGEVEVKTLFSSKIAGILNIS